MIEFLKELGIEQEAIKSDDGCYIINIIDSDEYGSIYSLLDNSELVEEDSDSSLITENSASIQYVSDEYLITLMADFDGDMYSLTIKER